MLEINKKIFIFLGVLAVLLLVGLGYYIFYSNQKIILRNSLVDKLINVDNKDDPNRKYTLNPNTFENKALLDILAQVSYLIRNNPREARVEFYKNEQKIISLIKTDDDELAVKMTEADLLRNQPLREDALKAIKIVNELFHDERLLPISRARYGVLLANVPQGDSEMRKIAMSGEKFKDIQATNDETKDLYNICQVVVGVYPIGRCISFITAVDAYNVFEEYNSKKITKEEALEKGRKIMEKMQIVEDEILKETEDAFADRLTYPLTVIQRNNAYGALSAIGVITDKKLYQQKFEDSIRAFKVDSAFNERMINTYISFSYTRYMLALGANGDYEKAKEVMSVLQSPENPYQKMPSIYAMPKNFLKTGHYYEKFGINQLSKNVSGYKDTFLKEF